jgi:predicted O-methyltransferase YrrM
VSDVPRPGKAQSLSRRLVDLLQAYVAARRVAREIRSLPVLSPREAFAYAQRRMWRGGDSIVASQREEEIVPLLELLSQDPPRTILEIGMHKGGTLFLWTRVAAEDALLVTVELRPIFGRLGRQSPFVLVRRAFARASQRIEFVDRADSGAGGTVERVKTALGNRAVDFLFIDGDHRYEAVKRDFELYVPLVRPGGVVALHDVSPMPTATTGGPARFWQEFAASNPRCTQFVADGVRGYGIGIYHVPAA